MNLAIPLGARAKIWGTNLLHNPPSLWVTINPSDTQDPIAQVFAGVDIDLDVFCKTAGPDSVDRSTNVASDLYASAKFFHFMNHDRNNNRSIIWG